MPRHCTSVRNGVSPAIGASNAQIRNFIMSLNENFIEQSWAAFWRPRCFHMLRFVKDRKLLIDVSKSPLYSAWKFRAYLRGVARNPRAFDFISNLMLLHILKGPRTVAGWVHLLESAGARAGLVSDGNDTVLNNWMSLLPRLQPYLSPGSLSK